LKGTLYNPQDDRTQHSCGHKKESEFDEINFLDPTKVVDISDYFLYDVDDLTINAAAKNTQSAQYTIDILRLNAPGLPESRRNALRSFQRNLRKIDNVAHRKAKMIEILNSNDKPFVSFLRYKYRAILAA
jgi:hypothetical protein